MQATGDAKGQFDFAVEQSGESQVVLDEVEGYLEAPRASVPIDWLGHALIGADLESLQFC